MRMVVTVFGSIFIDGSRDRLPEGETE